MIANLPQYDSGSGHVLTRSGRIKWRTDDLLEELEEYFRIYFFSLTTDRDYTLFTGLQQPEEGHLLKTVTKAYK